MRLKLLGELCLHGRLLLHPELEVVRSNLRVPGVCRIGELHLQSLDRAMLLGELSTSSRHSAEADGVIAGQDRRDSAEFDARLLVVCTNACSDSVDRELEIHSVPFSGIATTPAKEGPYTNYSINNSQSQQGYKAVAMHTAVSERAHRIVARYLSGIMSGMIQKAADFSLKDDTGRTHTLLDYAGKWIVLYFYPKDDTPGCTVEACSLRDARDELAAMGAQIIGISRDEPSAHEAFKAKYSLNFTLLSDPRGEVIRAYGAWGKKMYGREGILRKTFIINPEGGVVKVFGRATPLGHGQQVIAALSAAQAS